MSPLKKKKRKISETIADGQGRTKEAKGAADFTATGIVPIPAPTKRSHPFAQNPSNSPALPVDTSSSAVSLPETDETDPAVQQDQDKPSAATSIGAEAIEGVASSESNDLPVEITVKTGEGEELLLGNHPVAAVAVAVFILHYTCNCRSIYQLSTM